MKTFAVVGLGYVGLGLAVALGKNHRTIGYDINKERICSELLFENRSGLLHFVRKDDTFIPLCKNG